MKTSEKSPDKPDEIVIQGRVFKPVYKRLLDNMPRDLVQEMALRRLEEIKSSNAAQKKQ